jgi:hypothetical protein
VASCRQRRTKKAEFTLKNAMHIAVWTVAGLHLGRLRWSASTWDLQRKAAGIEYGKKAGSSSRPTVLISAAEMLASAQDASSRSDVLFAPGGRGTLRACVQNF